jgi:hypothetical protein
MARTLRSLMPAALFFNAFTVGAQNSVDIATVPGQNDDIEVRVRFENDFDGYFAASVFTVRWSEASGASLGTVQQDAQVQEYHDVNTSGSEQTDNGYRYQVFAGFGGSVLSDIPLTLWGGEWITLCTIPVLNGADVFTIVNDDFTATVNGDYFVSLGGQESQGEIIDLNTAAVGHAAAPVSFSVYPTITSGLVSMEADLGDADLIGLSVVNATGQEVWTSALSGMRGPLRRVIDMSGLDAEAYVVRLITPGRSLMRRVVRD